MGNRGLGYGNDQRFPAGTGLPPEADPPSWSNVSAQNRNLSAVQEHYGNKYGQLYKGSSYTGGIGFGYVNGMDGCRGSQKGQLCFDDDADADGSGASSPLCDYVAYTDAVDKLRFAAANYNSTGQPFFLAVGIRRPHLTWRVPKHYWDLYPANKTTLPKQKLLDKSIDPIAWTTFLDLGGQNPYEYTNTDEQVRQYRAAYYAAVSWGDYVAGRVLGELDSLNLSDSTAVVMHSDHGWHLGEYNMWEKRTLWENAARVPLVMRVPWIPAASQGRHTPALVELVDIYRTICDLLAVPLPVHDAHPVEGSSLVPILEHPAWKHLYKDAALTTYPRCPSNEAVPWKNNACIHSVEKEDFGFMGYSMRVDHNDGCSYRYTEWPRWNGTLLEPIWEDVKAVELYNHTVRLSKDASEFDSYENANLAQTVDPALIKALSTRLRSAFGFSLSTANIVV